MIEILALAGLAAVAANILGFVFGYYTAIQTLHGILNAETPDNPERRFPERPRNTDTLTVDEAEQMEPSEKQEGNHENDTEDDSSD